MLKQTWSNRGHGKRHLFQKLQREQKGQAEETVERVAQLVVISIEALAGSHRHEVDALVGVARLGGLLLRRRHLRRRHVRLGDVDGTRVG